MSADDDRPRVSPAAAEVLHHDAEVRARHPGLRVAAAVVHLDGPSAAAPAAWLADAAAAARDHLDGRAPTSMPEVVAWREVFSSFVVEAHHEGAGPATGAALDDLLDRLASLGGRAA